MLQFYTKIKDYMGDVYGELVVYSVLCVTLPLHTLVQSSLAIKITRYKDLSSV